MVNIKQKYLFFLLVVSNRGEERWNMAVLYFVYFTDRIKEKLRGKFILWILQLSNGNPKIIDHKNGILYLKGGDLSEELAPYKAATIYPLSAYFKEEFFETKKGVYLPMKYK